MSVRFFWFTAYTVTLVVLSTSDIVCVIRVPEWEKASLATSSKLWKQLSQDVFKVSGPSFHTSSKLFHDVQYGLVDRVLWQIVPCGLQDFIQLVDGIWAGWKCLVAFTHSSSDMIVKRLEVWWVRWPFVFSNAVTAVGGNPVLSQLCRVSRRSVLLEYETR